MKKRTSKKQDFTVPNTVLEIYNKLKIESDRIFNVLDYLFIKVKKEAVDTLLIIYSYWKNGYKNISTEMVNALDECSRNACYTKLHRLAGKKLLLETHEPKRVYFDVTQKTDTIMDGFFKFTQKL